MRTIYPYLVSMSVGLGALTAIAQTHPAATKDNVVQVTAYQKKPATGNGKAYATRTIGALPEIALDGERDRFGGLKAVTREATGFFRVEKRSDTERWWMIDPEGHPYIDAGMVAVSTQHGPTFKAAFAEKFGTAEKWREATLGLLKGAGFTGTGAWSSDELLTGASEPERMPYTPLVAFMAGYGKKRGGTYQQPGHTGYPGDCIFVFEPGFEAYAEETAKGLVAKAGDPWLVGYMSDNEMPFYPTLLTKFRALPAGDAGRVAADDWFAARHGGDEQAKETKDDMEAFRAFVADRYYGIVERAIHKYDPHHLYMGSRCNSTERESEPFMVAAGKHVDLLTVNVYGIWSPGEKAKQWAAACGKPVMVTEFYAKGNDSGMANVTGAGWTVATQAERGLFYQNFTLDLLESKACVGWTWFKYADNDPAEISVDPSNLNSNKGIVNMRYEPYAPLVKAMQEVNARVYGVAGYFDRAK